MVCIVKCTFISHSAVVMLSGELMVQADNSLRTSTEETKIHSWRRRDPVGGWGGGTLLQSVQQPVGARLVPDPELGPRDEKGSKWGSLLQEAYSPESELCEAHGKF